MTLFPILIDESIYMRWAEIIQHQHEWFISLLDAKPPLLFWLYASLRPLVADPLLGARLVSLCAGCLTVLVLYRIGYLCGGVRCGLITAFLDAVLPFGVLYDRIGYTDSVVNFCGACVVYSSITAFGKAEVPWRRTLVVGLILGTGLFVKTTVVLYAACPLAIGAFLHQSSKWRLSFKLVILYATAALFPIWAHFAVPKGPTAPTNNTFLHHTSFFTPISRLIRDPTQNLSYNLPLLKDYATIYVGAFVLSAASLALLALLVKRSYLSVIIVASSLGPLLIVSLLLTYFPSRYAFSVAWPLLLMVACGLSETDVMVAGTALAYACEGVILLSMLVQDFQMLRAPERALFKGDAKEFLGGGPYSGSGVKEAVTFLRKEAGGRRAIILTDPWWGPPTDAVFAYLNRTDEIEVYEAWWLQVGAPYPLVPNGVMPVWKSQYQRVFNASVDFSAVSPLYYLTDSFYRIPKDVHLLDGSARLIRRFPKRNGSEFIDVYRLN